MLGKAGLLQLFDDSSRFDAEAKKGLGEEGLRRKCLNEIAGKMTAWMAERIDSGI